MVVDMGNISKYLAEHDIRPSYQRLRIFEYLVKNRNHPTVDIIYKDLISDIPTLSRTTVYNTLKLFFDKGIVLVLNIEDAEARFDADISLHGHFKCKVCSKVYDFGIDTSKLSFDSLKNFDVDETHIYLKGICDNCKK